MTFKQLFELINKMDELSDPDFFIFYQIMLIRAMRRDLRRRRNHNPPDTKKLSDGDPTRSA